MRVKIISSRSGKSKQVGKAENYMEAHALAWDYLAETNRPPLSLTVSMSVDKTGKFWKAQYW